MELRPDLTIPGRGHGRIAIGGAHGCRNPRLARASYNRVDVNAMIGVPLVAAVMLELARNRQTVGGRSRTERLVDAVRTSADRLSSKLSGPLLDDRQTPISSRKT